MVTRSTAAGAVLVLAGAAWAAGAAAAARSPPRSAAVLLLGVQARATSASRTRRAIEWDETGRVTVVAPTRVSSPSTRVAVTPPARARASQRAATAHG